MIYSGEPVGGTRSGTCFSCAQQLVSRHGLKVKLEQVVDFEFVFTHEMPGICIRLAHEKSCM